MTTFNEFLRASSVEPRQVILLRHTAQKGALGIRPYDLLMRRDGSFDRYQSTQKAGQPIFLRSPYWASFVGKPDGSTLFVGLYASRLGDPSSIDWNCPITGSPPGADKGHLPDLFHLQLVDALHDQREVLEIDWGGGFVAWVQSAHGNDKVVLCEGQTDVFRQFLEAPEGERLWREQRDFERNHRLVAAAFDANAMRNGGIYHCESCSYASRTRGLFDAHHPNPLANGPRTTRVNELVILCPTCHRKAHTSGNRLRPLSLDALRNWVGSGRP